MRLHAETAGRGPDLVLLHGWGLHSGIWTPLLPALSRRFRVTCVDLPGHGHSPARRTASGSTTRPRRSRPSCRAGAAWLGWSLGGQLALARRSPATPSAGSCWSRRRRDSSPRPTGLAAWPPRHSRALQPRWRVDHRQAVRDFLALQLRGDRRAATLLPALRETLLERGDPAPAGLRAGLEILAATDLRERLAALRQPALVIAGERDRLTPAEAGPAPRRGATRRQFHRAARGGACSVPDPSRGVRRRGGRLPARRGSGGMSGDPFSLDTRRVRASFDAAAAAYDAVAVVQAEVRRRLLERLELFRIRPGGSSMPVAAPAAARARCCATTGAPSSSRWTSRRVCCMRRDSSARGCGVSTPCAPMPPRCRLPTLLWTWCSPT
jgi:pimeloyl-[acyl-carrier protein] methyl ester esterase